MTQPADYTAHVEARFVDDDDLVRTGRALVELDGLGFVHVPVPEGWAEQVQAVLDAAVEADTISSYVGAAEAAAVRAEAGAASAAADHAQTGQDRVQTGQDREATGQDREATGADRQAVADDRVFVAGARSDISEMSAATIYAAGIVKDLWEESIPGGGVSLVEDPPGSGLFVIGA